MKYFTTVQKLEPESPSLYLKLYEIFAQEPDMDELAKKILREGLELDPKNI